MEDYQLIKTNKGKPKLVVGGFEYTVEKVAEDVTYWRCSKRCGSRCSTANAKFTKEPTEHHGHEPKTVQVMAAKVAFDEVKKLAPLGKPSQVLARFRGTIGEEVGTSFATDKQLKARIAYARKKEYGGNVPIEEFLEKVHTVDGRKFVLSEGDHTQMVIFGTKENVRRLMGCSEWMSDGTFSAVVSKVQ